MSPSSSASLNRSVRLAPSPCCRSHRCLLLASRPVCEPCSSQCRTRARKRSRSEVTPDLPACTQERHRPIRPPHPRRRAPSASENASRAQPRCAQHQSDGAHSSATRARLSVDLINDLRLGLRERQPKERRHGNKRHIGMTMQVG